ANGAAGSSGKDGSAGQSVTGTVEAPGTNCQYGGVKYVSASGTNYVCNGAPGMTGPPGASPVSCTPGQAFCDGSKLWTCTTSGLDAIGGTDCAADPASTGNNPMGCFVTGCAPGQAACCRRTNSVANWSFTQPSSFSGSTNGVWNSY